MHTITINGRVVGPGEPAFLIAEVGQNHDGSLGTAHAYVDAAADAGADAVKFQTHIAAEESTLDEPFRVKFSKQDETRFAYWKRMEFSAEQWQGLADHARERGIIFLSSPFSEAAVDLLAGVGMPAWKVGSGEVFNDRLMKAMARNPAPVLLSSGMSSYDEIAASVDAVQGLGMDCALFQCTSAYPVPYDKVGLNVLHELKKRHGCPVGLSDHSGTMFPSLAAMAQGADLIEVHVTLSERAFGPDVSSSLVVEELALLAEARDAFFTMLCSPVDKDQTAEEMRPMRELFRKSIAPRELIPAGTVLEKSMLTLKKPGTGIPPEEMDTVIGKQLVKDAHPERLLRREDIGA